MWRKARGGGVNSKMWTMLDSNHVTLLFMLKPSPARQNTLLNSSIFPLTHPESRENHKQPISRHIFHQTRN